MCNETRAAYRCQTAGNAHSVCECFQPVHKYMSTYAGGRLREEVQALQAQLAEARQQAGSTHPVALPALHPVALPAALTPAVAESEPSVPDAESDSESDSAPAQAALAAETPQSPSGSPAATADAATATPAAATAAPPTATGRLPSQA